MLMSVGRVYTYVGAYLIRGLCDVGDDREDSEQSCMQR